jgi:gliding motility-associated protein GldM
MASGKLSPRQKMINMMYLVLTALLAMNVSSEILNAFKTVNRSLNKTITILASKNTSTYDALEGALKEPQTAAKAAVWNPVAKQIKAKSDEMYKFLETYKSEIIKGAGNENGERNEEDGELKYKEDDLDVSTRILIEENNAKKGKELYDRMKQYKKDVLGILATAQVEPNMAEQLKADIAGFEKSLPLQMEIPKKDHDGKPYSQDANGWLLSNFHMTPAVAVVTIMTKLQSDIRSSEGQLSDYCINQLGKVKFIYDKFAAVAAANTTYCMPGDPIEISAGVGAFNDQAKPQISIGGSSIPLVDGMAIKKLTAGGPGEYSVPVNIQFTTPAGEVKTERREIKYVVGQPSGAALMLDKMNVIYIGLDNPLTVSSGTGDEKTKLSAVGGGVTLSRSAPGKYIARATTIGNCDITVTADGKNTPFKFRVKKVPDPICTIGGTIKGGKIPRAQLMVQQGVKAILENFDFEAKFDVLSFNVAYSSKGDVFDMPVNGERFTDQVMQALKNCKPKDMFLIERVKVKGPDGTLRTITGTSVQVI